MGRFSSGRYDGRRSSVLYPWWQGAAVTDGRKFKRQRHQIGPVQRDFLRMVGECFAGRWFWGCGRYWKNESYDHRVARSLVRHGYLAERGGPIRPIFEITASGAKLMEKRFPIPLADGEIQ